MTHDLVKRVLSRWEDQGIHRDGVTEAALDALEASRGLALPTSFRALYLGSDGTASLDAHEIMFWPLDNIERDPSLGRTDDTLVFADYRLGACTFFARVERSVPGEIVAVWEIGGERVVASSFDALLARYLDEPSSLTQKPSR